MLILSNRLKKYNVHFTKVAKGKVHNSDYLFIRNSIKKSLINNNNYSCLLFYQEMTIPTLSWVNYKADSFKEVIILVLARMQVLGLVTHLTSRSLKLLFRKCRETLLKGQLVFKKMSLKWDLNRLIFRSRRRKIGRRLWVGSSIWFRIWFNIVTANTKMSKVAIFPFLKSISKWLMTVEVSSTRESWVW